MSIVTIAPVLRIDQHPELPVVCFQATPDLVTAIARIERAGRTEEGLLSGFQRPRIAEHIREIRDFLEGDRAILPNAIVLGFAGKAELDEDGTLRVDVSDGPPGWVVDGQQRLTAAMEATGRRFPLLVSAFLCADRAELNRQFILINNTRPLSRQLIYELLPGTEGLPERLSTRSLAALLTEALNFREESALKGIIQQQTNPKGLLKDTLIQRMIMNSFADGFLMELQDDRERLLTEGYTVINEFFWAVRTVFKGDWDGHKPKTSRLLHGAGIIGLGYVLETLHAEQMARTRKDFIKGLSPLLGKTAWTSGEWNFGDQKRPWNAIQNNSADYRLLQHFLVRNVRPIRVWSAA